MSDQPLISMLVMTYRQAPWVAQAIRGALSQTYQPLEIIISDDCSPDETWAVIQGAVAGYQGPHSLVVRRNETNLGIAGHLDSLVRSARGELVVYACGDDVSAPHRVARIADEWARNGRGTFLAQSHYVNIDDEGRPLSMNDGFSFRTDAFASLESLAETNMFVLGSSSAYTTDLIRRFPPFVRGLVHEDRATPFRARLLNAPVVTIEEPLVQYRRSGVTSGYEQRLTQAQALTFFRRVVADYEQKILDASSLGRRDLLPLLRRKLVDYQLAAASADPQVSSASLVHQWLAGRPSVGFALRQVAKFRIAAPASAWLQRRRGTDR